MKKTIIIGVIIVTVCIIYLTNLAGDALKSSIQAQDVRNELIMNSTNIDSSCCINTLPTYQKDSALSSQDSSLAARQHVFVDKDSTITSTRPTKSTTNSSDYLDSIVYNLTLAVNAVNNVLTSGSIFIAILTLFIGLVGLFGFYSLKSDLKDKIAEFDAKVIKNENRIKVIDDLITKCCSETKDKIDEVDGKINTFEQRINTRLQEYLADIDRRNEVVNTTINEFIDFQTRQEEYINQTINYLFQATSAIINQMSDQDQAREIFGTLYHAIHIAHLYRTSLNADHNDEYDRQRFAAFAYLEMNGTIEDIPHLDYVVEHEPDEHIRQRAIEVRAIIRNRNNN